jgi:NitT/TauT family transport system ATP-binding protein
VFFVTHDITEAVYLADRVAVMEGGRIHKDIAVDLPRPRGNELRYSPKFNEICAQLRHAMDGGQP